MIGALYRIELVHACELLLEVLYLEFPYVTVKSRIYSESGSLSTRRSPLVTGNRFVCTGRDEKTVVLISVFLGHHRSRLPNDR